MNKNQHVSFLWIIVVGIILSLASCKPKNTPTLFTGNVFGTTFKIEIVDANTVTAAQIDSIFTYFNHALSTYQENSLISAFNANSNALWKDTAQLKYLKSDLKLFIYMVDLSKDIFTLTKGAFDPSAAPLFTYWKQGKTSEFTPDSAAIKLLLAHIGMHKLATDEDGLPYKLDSAVQLNFNAIAKGYGVDVVAEFLSNKGIRNYLVEIGGEVRCAGLNAANKPWTIGVNIPLIGVASKESYKDVELNDMSLATSGNYRDFYYLKDEIIGHTINPKTGWPAKNSLKSVSVFHKQCAVADAYATAFMVLGLEQSRQIVEEDENLSALFIYEENNELKDVLVQ